MKREINRFICFYFIAAMKKNQNPMDGENAHTFTNKGVIIATGATCLAIFIAEKRTAITICITTSISASATFI